MDFTPYLDDLEARISPEIEQRLARDWESFARGYFTGEVFRPSREKNPARIEWKPVCVNDAFRDPELMIYSQLKSVSDTLASGSGLLLSVRANYGTGIIPSMFGAEIMSLPDSADMLPGAMPLPDDRRIIDRLIETEADFGSGLITKVFEFGERFRELIRPYSKLKRFVHIYNPDFQGPFPLVDMLLGSRIYTDMYDDPDGINVLLARMTSLYLELTKKWQKLCPPYSSDMSVEWGLLHRGLTMLRNDAVMNISPDMYREFVEKYDSSIFFYLGGGMHFCGRGDHYIDIAAGIKNLSCINMSQPHLNDMEKIYKHTVDRGILIVGMPRAEVDRALASGRPLHGRVQT